MIHLFLIILKTKFCENKSLIYSIPVMDEKKFDRDFPRPDFGLNNSKMSKNFPKWFILFPIS